MRIPKTLMALLLVLAAGPARAGVIDYDLAGGLPGPAVLEEDGLAVTFEASGVGYRAIFSAAVRAVSLAYGTAPGVSADGGIVASLMAFGYPAPGATPGLLAMDASSGSRDTLTAAVTGTAGILEIAFSSPAGAGVRWERLQLAPVPAPLTPALVGLGLALLGAMRRYGLC